MNNTKCNFQNDLLIPCSLLAQSAEDFSPVGKRKGLFTWTYVSITSGKISRIVYGAKSGQYINGIYFNYCPFCGVDITSSFMHESE